MRVVSQPPEILPSEPERLIAEMLEAASELARAKIGRVDAVRKPEDNNQVLTEADLEIGRLLLSSISSRYPDHSVIDEEAGVIDNRSDFIWITDPIDGTSNYAVGLPTYGIMVGLLYRFQPLAGGIALPAFGETYLASRGNGARLGGRPVSVTAERDLADILLSYGVDGNSDDPAATRQEMSLLAEMVLRAMNLRTSNSAFDSVMTVSGKYGANLNRSGRVWDHVAPHILMQEAGGLYTDFWGRAMDYSECLMAPSANYTCCAGAAALHAQLQGIIHAHPSDPRCARATYPASPPPLAGGVGEGH
jgi:myo-inositol-1(or 4)-monophosphatase